MRLPLSRHEPFHSAAGFPEWAAVMDGWGGKMLAAADTVARLAAAGFGLPEDALVSRLVMGPHLLAPTGALISNVFL